MACASKSDPSAVMRGFAQEVARSCELPFDKLPSIRPDSSGLLGANGWFIAPFVVSLAVLSEVEGSNHASAFQLLVQSRDEESRTLGVIGSLSLGFDRRWAQWLC